MKDIKRELEDYGLWIEKAYEEHRIEDLYHLIDGCEGLLYLYRDMLKSLETECRRADN